MFNGINSMPLKYPSGSLSDEGIAPGPEPRDNVQFTFT